jgi:archaellum component FlaC
MDQELIAYLDERFRASAQHVSAEVSALREETRQQISSLREETTQQISSLREETTQQISSLREETTQQISSLREETMHQISGYTQQISSLREEMTQRFEGVETAIRHTQVLVEGVRDNTRLIAEGVIGMGERLDTYQAHQTHRLDEELDAIKLNLKDLNRRVAIVEGHHERETTDVMTLIRRRWAKTQPEEREAKAEAAGG